jgi:hypothetical protein
MGGSAFDRKSYYREPEVQPPAPPRPPVITQDRLIYLVVILTILAAGIVAFKILGSSSLPDPSRDDAALNRIAERLDELEHRQAALEEKLSARKPAPVKEEAKPEPPKAPPPVSAPITRVRYIISPAPKVQPASSAPAQPFPEINALRQEHDKALNSLRSDVVASRQEWAATTDRLGNVVGELNSQRQEITRNREGLEQIEEHFQRDSIGFTLYKNGEKRQVGPVRLLLENTDAKNSRYTMRLFFADRWIELKDRALDEAIQFYTPEGEVALELVVSQIAKNAVVGKLTLPQTTASR